MNQTWAYGEFLGFEDLGPDDIYLPAQVYRCTPDATWTIGSYWPEDLTDSPSWENPECGGGEECPWDIDQNGKVNIDDLFLILGAWGTCDDCPEDVNGDGKVNIDDLFEILGHWGPCP